MSFVLLAGWKWLWIPLLTVVCLVMLLFAVSLTYFLIVKWRHLPGTIEFENLNKEEAMPPRPRSGS
jgi:hypothetical protein